MAACKPPALAPPVAAKLPLVGNFAAVRFLFDRNHAKKIAVTGESSPLQLIGFKNCFGTRISVDMKFIVTNFTVLRFAQRKARQMGTGRRLILGSPNIIHKEQIGLGY